MPKRMLDDSLLSSPSLAKCSPRAQDAWPRFLLLMDDFGCAEANPRVLVGRGWPLRDDVTERDVWGWLEEYVGAGMAVLWTENERRFVHLTGWFGPHGQRRREEYDGASVAGRKGSKRKTPAPPAELVAAVTAGFRRDHDGKPPGIDRESESPAANPPGNATPENPSNSVPARDCRGNQPGNADSRGECAPAVPVPVAEEALSLSHARALAAAEQADRDAVRALGAADGERLRGGLPTQDEIRATKYPRLADLLTAVRSAGQPVEWPKANAGCAEAAMALGDQPLEAVVPRVVAAVVESGRLGLGWHFDAIRGGPRPRTNDARPRSRGMAIPDTDWTSEAATKL